jgi:hypothetical protein
MDIAFSASALADLENIKAYYQELDRARALLGAKLNKIQGWESVERKAG